MSNKSWLAITVPAGWDDVIIRTVKAFLIAFVIYHVKEYIDAGRFDTAELAIDALWLAGGALILEAILLIVGNPNPKRK